MAGQKGFTLIELLTTLAIASILLAVAVPGMRTFGLNSHQAAGVNEFVSSMHLARNTAITNNARVTICASSNGESCQPVPWDKGWIVFIDLDGDATLDAGESMVRAGTTLKNISISSVQFGDFLSYRPNGRVMAANVNQNSGLFSICDERGPAHAKGIQLDFSGRPRLVEPESGGVSLSCN